jgi:hypothetical protein
MFYSDFHGTLHPGASHSVPAIDTPKFTAEEFLDSGIAERSAAANLPDPANQPVSDFQGDKDKENYFGA